MAMQADFNFIADGERQSLAAWALLIAGVLVLIATADNFAAAAADNQRLTDQVERFKRKGKSAVATAVAPLAARNGAPQQPSASAERRDVPVPPWDSLLREVELAADASVGLLSVDTDVAARHTRIAAEARNIDDALAFAARLRESPLIDGVLLLAHESKKSQAVAVVGFTLQLEWSAE